MAGVCGTVAIHIRNAGSVSIDNPMIDGGPYAINFTGMTGPLTIIGGVLANQTANAIDGNAGIAANTSCDFSIRGTKIRNTTTAAVSLTAVRSYDIDVDIDTAATGVLTTGSTVHSRIRGKMVSVTTPWSKSGTDTLTSWKVESGTALGFSVRSRTIASGVISVYAPWHYVDTEAAAASDDLDTINGGVEDDYLVLRAANSSRDVVLKDDTGNLRLAGDFTLNQARDTITLQKVGSDWHEVSRSDNAA